MNGWTTITTRDGEEAHYPPEATVDITEDSHLIVYDSSSPEPRMIAIYHCDTWNSCVPADMDRATHLQRQRDHVTLGDTP